MNSKDVTCLSGKEAKPCMHAHSLEEPVVVVVLLPGELRQLRPHGVRVGHGAGPSGHASHGGVAEEHRPGQPRGVGQHRGGGEQGRGRVTEGQVERQLIFSVSLFLRLM